MSGNIINSAIKSITNTVGALGTGTLANGLRAARAATESLDAHLLDLKKLDPNSPEYYDSLYGTAKKIAQDATAKFAKSQAEFSKDLLNYSNPANDKAWEKKASDVISTLKDTAADARDRVFKDAGNYVNNIINNNEFRAIYKAHNSIENFNSPAFEKDANGKVITENTIADADGNAINKNLNYAFHKFDDEILKQAGLTQEEFQQFSGDAGRLAKDSPQLVSFANNAQQKIDNASNITQSDKALLKADGESLAFIHANRLNTLGTEAAVNMLKEDKTYIDHAKENFSDMSNLPAHDIAHAAAGENHRALKELYKNDETKLNDTLDTLKKYGGVEDLSNFNRRTYDRSAKDMNFMTEKGADGKTTFDKEIEKLAEKNQRATFDLDIRIGGKAGDDSNGSGSNILNGIEFAQKSELKDLIGLVGEGGRNQLTLAFQDIDKAKEFVQKLQEGFKDESGSSKADIGNINLTVQTHGFAGENGGLVDKNHSKANITELSKEIGKLAAENNADSVEFNGNYCGSEKNAKELKEGATAGAEAVDGSNVLKITTLANDGMSSNDGQNLADRQGLTDNVYNADGSTSLQEQWSNGHKGDSDEKTYSTIRETVFANGNEDKYKEEQISESAKLSQRDPSLTEGKYTEASQNGTPIPDPEAKIDDGGGKRGDDSIEKEDDGALVKKP